MKLPVLENAMREEASGSVQLVNEPSAVQTRVTSIKVIYNGYLINNFLKTIHANLCPTGGRCGDGRRYPDQR